MRLIYTATQKPVERGDIVQVGNQHLAITHMPPPHKPDSSGKVTVKPVGEGYAGSGFEYFVGIIGAEWIEREDRAHWDREDREEAERIARGARS